MPSVLGQVVGSYRIVSELGRGGMGMVYRAEHVQLGRPAALKMLLPQFSTDTAIVQRFFNEARAASAIDHPGIVEIFDFGTHTDGSAYIVMALLKGESLEQRLKRAPITPTEGANILAQVAGALAAAHAQGIVHRDLKPDNIFLSPNDLMPGGVQVRLLDFGIAKLADEQSAGLKTQTGALMGTPAYMSPEQCMGKADIDHRTDLYAAGCILFHVLCGRPPFLSEHGTGVMIAAHIRDPAPHPRSLDPHVPEALAAIAMRLLEKEPAARFQTASELRTALVTAGADAPATWPPAGADQFAATLPPSPVPNTDPDAYAHTTAGSVAPGTTTQGGAAAELVTSSGTVPGSPRKLGMMIALGGVLLAGAAVAAFFAVRAGQGSDEAPTAIEPATAPAPAAPIATAPTAPDPAPVPPAPTQPAAEPPCPDGQGRTADTAGHCCWPDQVWSSTRSRCIGTPACPAGTRARGDSCEARAPEPAAIAGAKPTRRDKPPEPPPERIVEGPAAPTPRFTLGSKAYEAGATIEIRFDQAIRSVPSDRTWITVVEADKPSTSYGTWSYVDDQARTATLKAPTKPGAYEVRLHTEYPKKRTNVVHAVAVTIGAPAPPAAPTPTPDRSQRFTLAASSVAAGGDVELIFAAPMHADKGERFWATIVEKGKSDSSWGTYEYLPAGAKRLGLKAPSSPGDYEVRLHANFPTKSTNVVHRAALTVN